MKAVLLAAGAGQRLMPYTQSTPKHLLSLGETTIIHRTVDLLKSLGVSDISIVVGHLKEKYFAAFPKEIQFYINDDYAATDQAASLFKAKAKLTGDFLVVAGDLFCPRKVFAAMLADPRPLCVAIEKREERFDDITEKVCLQGERIAKIGKLNVLNGEANGEFLGLTKVSKEKAALFIQTLEASLSANPKSAIIHVHQRMIDQGESLSYILCQDPWCEIDEPVSWRKAQSIFQEFANY